MSFIAELKRRNVIRMAGLYLVGAWLIVQVAETLLPIFGTPGWALKTLVVLLALGFVPALVFSWVFELTPQGLKRDSEIPSSDSIAPQTARRMDRLIFVGLLALIAAIAADRYWPRAGQVAESDAATRASSDSAQPSDSKQPAPARVKTEITAPANSIAVLPFVNMSSDPEQEYFSDGISEEILNVLARTPELQVAARTSSFSFKGGKREVPEIARALNVRMVLEGSVRKQGERVRITAQLIDAQNGFHLLSKTFDRDLKDIFAIQDEIARAIADELKVKLGTAPAPGATSAGTRNIEAYDLYLQGLGLWQLRREDSLWKAIGLFERAAAADPEFAEAHAGLALVYAVLADYSARITYAESRLKARDHAERALGLDSNLPEPYAVLAQLAFRERRRATGDVLSQRGISLNPSFATAHQWRGTSLMEAGDLKAGLASLERASALDPRSRVVANNHGWLLISLGRYAEANVVCERVLAFAPDYAYCLDNIAFTHLSSGNLDAARTALERRVAVSKPQALGLVTRLVDALQGRGDRTQVAARLAAFSDQSVVDPDSENVFQNNQVPSLLVLLGENELALARMEKLARDDSLSGVEWAIMAPALDPIRCDPRFVAVVTKMQTTDPHFARVCRKAR